MQTIGDYEYNTKVKLGQGSFGVVYKGRPKKNPSLSVAIKCITMQSADLSEIVKEVTILMQFRHENVVALFNVYVKETSVFLVMEYCNGIDLENYLLQRRTLSEDTIRLFLKQLANGLKALSAKRIIHRDLKPQNILLTYDVPNPQPSQIKLKIADFGLARSLQHGDKAGTCIAPEVCCYLPYDAKSDLWSLGIIVFKCLTGGVPFQPQQLFDRNTRLVPKIPNGTSAELTHLLLSLLKHDAKQRIDVEQFFDHQFLRGVSKGFDFVNCHNFHLPDNAVKAGSDLDGSAIYVGQAHYRGDTLPCKIVPARRQAYISYDGKEVLVPGFKVLVQIKNTLSWVASQCGNVPTAAIPAGKTSSGETLYVGRTIFLQSAVVGKVHPSHGSLYMPFDGQEMAFSRYEVLTY